MTESNQQTRPGRTAQRRWQYPSVAEAIAEAQRWIAEERRAGLPPPLVRYHLVTESRVIPGTFDIVTIVGDEFLDHDIDLFIQVVRRLRALASVADEGEGMLVQCPDLTVGYFEPPADEAKVASDFERVFSRHIRDGLDFPATARGWECAVANGIWDRRLEGR